MHRSARTTWTAIAGATSVALLATACSSSGGDNGSDGGGSSDAQITLTVSTFNEWGYDDLLDEYMALNPNITVEHQKYATSDEAREQFNTGMAAGSGLADVAGVEVDWMPEIMQYADQFTDLTNESVEGRWQDWKVAQATTTDGQLLGYGTDIGPEAIAYRADLFKAAGLPSDRESVAEIFGGDSATWDDFYSVGADFTAAGTGVPFYDSTETLYQAQINQVAEPYEDPETDEIIALDNPDVKNIYEYVEENADGLSAGLSQWGEDWVAAFQNNGFAVMLAPSWMLGVIEGNAAGVEGWDIANVFPGGGNWGGSFLTVPAQSEHPEEARELADWLTAPEQQLKAFETTGNFPSQVEAQTSDKLAAVTNEFFNDAPIGKIFADRADAIDVNPYKGPNFFAVNTEMMDAIKRVDVQKTDDIDSSWTKFETAVKALG